MTVEPSEEDAEAMHALIQEMTEKLTDVTRKLGLYLEHVGLVSKNPSEMGMPVNLEDFRGQIARGEVILAGHFAVGDIAWEKRTLNPEQDEIDNQVRMILPDPVEELREKIRRAQAEGRDPIDEED